MFNNTCLCRYLCPRKVVFDNISEFKQDFNPLLKYLNIKPVLTSINNPQANSPVERVHKVILNMLITKVLDNKVFDHIYPWSETLAYISWAVRASYNRTIMSTSVQDIFVIDMIFKLSSVVDLRVVTAAKQCQ